MEHHSCERDRDYFEQWTRLKHSGESDCVYLQQWASSGQVFTCEIDCGYLQHCKKLKHTSESVGECLSDVQG
ncbi:hypothetical protein CHS0354_042930 [Potamilus streckersoni]|uniref:Uncharacterized protein n=1 Tax=Potamilus streckersoni TaxID=2493646 RepID=A0AAE0T5L5_9BIVA|nr:hypothetical protein CHS0354_042930 [Potamilus streckersoni]